MLGENDPELMKLAIEYHQEHERLSDPNGKLLASINLGLCYESLGNEKGSIIWFQNALKYSIQLSNLSGQTLAIGNMGKIGKKALIENKDKMKLFIEKYLKLSEEMHDNQG